MERLLAVGTVVVALLLAGCSEDGDPEPRISPTDSSSAASTPTAPVSTDGSSESLPVSPRQALLRWFDEFSAAMLTGDPSEVEAVATSDCTSCGNVVNAVLEIYEKGGRLESDPWIVERVVTSDASQASVHSYLVRVAQGARTLYGEDGQVVDSTPKMVIPFSVTVVAVDGGWLVSRMAIVR